MTFHPPMGRWSDRRAAADERRRQRDLDYADSVQAQVRRERAALREEAERLAQIEAEQRAAEALKLRVSCPCCAGRADGVLATKAEMIIRAVAALGEGTRPDDWNMRRLHAIAVGADDGHLIIPASLSYPKPIAKPADTAAAVTPSETPAEHKAAVTPKRSK